MTDATEKKMTSGIPHSTKAALGSTWDHFDAAYKKACESSQPDDWMQAALIAQQVRHCGQQPTNSTDTNLLKAALNYIKHCGANQVARGESHPQQHIVDGLESFIERHCGQRDRDSIIEECVTAALSERCERGTVWDVACTTIARKLRSLKRHDATGEKE